MSIPTLSAASKAIRDAATTSRALTEACLGRIEAENPGVNAIITVMREEALAQATALDAEARAGKFRSPLHGVPIALKDNIDTAHIRTTNASAVTKDRVPSEDAHVVRRLKEAGAVIIAKANLAEFSLTPTGMTSHYGPVRNPRYRDRVPGGSSSGSAAAVAAGMCLGALGTDSGGSVRIPAAWCGLVGLKPTIGLVSFRGIGPGLPSLDTCGALSRSVEDVALMLTQMAGYDALDPISVDHPRQDYALGLGRQVSGLRIGVQRRPFFDGLDGQIADAVENALTALAGITAGIRDVALDGMEPSDGLINAAEICSSHEESFANHADAYQPATRNVVGGCGAFVNDPDAGSASEKMARYIRSRAALFRRQRTIDAAFDGFDVLVSPTTKTLPPTVEVAMASEYGTTPYQPSLAAIENTYAFNILGLPALTVPCGVSSEGLPIGLMICGPRHSEATLLALGAAYEELSPWPGLPGM